MDKRDILHNPLVTKCTQASFAEYGKISQKVVTTKLDAMDKHKIPVRVDRRIHQIYWDFGKGKLTNIPVYSQSHRAFSKLGYKYLLWSEEDCEHLVHTHFQKYLQFYNNLRHKIQKIDFAKLLILFVHGGLYVDLDIIPLRDFSFIFQQRMFFHNVRDVKQRYSFAENDILAFQKNDPILKELIDYIITQYDQKSKNGCLSY